MVGIKVGLSLKSNYYERALTTVVTVVLGRNHVYLSLHGAIQLNFVVINVKISK